MADPMAEEGEGSVPGLVKVRNLGLVTPLLSQDDLRDQAQKLGQRLTETEAEKSQLHTELQALQRQLSQNQEGEGLKAGGEFAGRREERQEAQRGRIRPGSHSTAYPQL